MIRLDKQVLKPSIKISMIAVMTAAAISSNYLLIGVFNVKFMDLIVFTSGYVFGCGFGATVGVLIWLIYGILNPYGFSLLVLLSTIIGETLYGIAGGYLTSILPIKDTWKPDLRFSIVGFILTFVYDVFTNVISAINAGVPLMVAIISGIPFALIHELSNAVFFAFGVPPLVHSIRKIIRMQYNVE